MTRKISEAEQILIAILLDAGGRVEIENLNAHKLDQMLRRYQRVEADIEYNPKSDPSLSGVLDAEVLLCERMRGELVEWDPQAEAYVLKLENLDE